MVEKRTTRTMSVAFATGVLVACGGATPSDETAESTSQLSTEIEVQPSEPVAPQSIETNVAPALDASPISASGPSDALSQVNERDETRRRVSMETGNQIDPLLLDVSWPYGTCIDAASLLPPPKESWRLFAMSAGEWPQSKDMARITYSSVDESLSPGTPEHGASKQNISIYISSGTADAQGMKDIYTNSQLASVMLEPGPYNYPIRKMPAGFPGRGALLGDYFVQLDGTGKDMDAYFATIMRCAIDNGLIAEGVDRASLRDVP